MQTKNLIGETDDANADQFGFLRDFSGGVTFHFNNFEGTLTLRAPDGYKFGLSMAHGIKSLTENQIHAARMANEGRGQF